MPIARDLHIASSVVIWLVAGLYLTSAIAQPTLGKVGDVFGPRKVYLGGLVVVLVAGVLPFLVSGFAGVLLARVLIGFTSDKAGLLQLPTAALAGVAAVVVARTTACCWSWPVCSASGSAGSPWPPEPPRCWPSSTARCGGLPDRPGERYRPITDGRAAIAARPSTVYPGRPFTRHQEAGPACY